MSYFGLPYIHSVFDVAAWLASMTVFWLTTRHLLPADVLPANRVSYPGAYAVAAGAGALCGAMFFGTANTLLSGVHALGFSMAGGIAGAIASVEAFKRLTGVTGSTGIAFAAPFAATVAVGRLGCFFSGLADFTYGTPTALPWAVDFGDGVPRHPVQLYELLAMAAMFVLLIERFRARDPFWLANGFHLAVGWYALQRFAWEFLKPYVTVVGPLNLFHIGLPCRAPIRCFHDPQPERRMHDGLARKSAPYLFLGQTTSLCETCLGLVPAKIVEEDGGIYYLKRCAEHGVAKTLVCDDPVYWRRTLDYLKPGDRPLAPGTRTERGCPWDCGLCPDHEQHSCLAIIEVNEACNLACPVCFADSSPRRTAHRSLTEVARMFDVLLASEGEPDLVQISGGEPTLHPQILEILVEARRRPIRHVMLNTNGIRIAEDQAFVDRLAGLKPGFEVYLQFDSLNDKALKDIRGAALSRIRRKALANLEARNVSTTLVCTVKRGVNDREIGDIVHHALTYRRVRGVNFQPVQDAGRNGGFDSKRNRIVLSEIRRRIVEDSGVFADGDMIPLPCNPSSISIGYGLRDGDRVIPLTSLVPREALLPSVPNAISFEKYPELRQRFVDLLSLSTTDANTAQRLGSLLCCLPGVPLPEGAGYENVFRITIVEFLDRFNFCLANVKRSCIHFVTPDGAIIPFDTYNTFYRPGAAGNARLAGARR